MPKGIYSRKPTNRQKAMKSGELYYDGRACKNCGSTSKYVQGQHCVSCKRSSNIPTAQKRQYHKQWCIANREQDRQHKTRWRNEHQEQARAASELWRKRHPERHSFYQGTRRAKKRNAPGTHTYEEWRSLVEKFGSICLCCKISERRLIKTTGRALTEDHIIPLSNLAATNNLDNIQPLCLECNIRNYHLYKKTGVQKDFRW
jgi:hypothetical protein